jgi:transposase
MGQRGVFLRMMEGLAAASATPKTIMIDATYLKAHRTASSLREKGGAWAPHRSHQGGMNTKLHTVTDAEGRPLSFFMTAGQVSDYTGVAALLDDLPNAQWMLGDRGHDADRYRNALQAKGITPCIPGRKSRITPVKYDKRRYRSRSRIEIMFGRLKERRRVAARYDRCSTVFFSAVALAATVIWL